MLTELNQIALQADGRYLMPSEWQPVQTYLAQMRQRLSAYSKIQAAEADIRQEVEKRLFLRSPRFLCQDKPDILNICRRDRENALRYISAMVLTGDMMAYKQRMLCWLQTVSRSFPFYHESARQAYEVMAEVLKEKLTPQEFDLVRPFVELTGEMLSS
ncbi:MAG: hypothetical protein Q6J44_06860 [Gloeomargarita sp. DG02_4_bins_56]